MTLPQNFRFRARAASLTYKYTKASKQNTHMALFIVDKCRLTHPPHNNRDEKPLFIFIAVNGFVNFCLW